MIKVFQIHFLKVFCILNTLKKYLLQLFSSVDGVCKPGAAWPDPRKEFPMKALYVDTSYNIQLFTNIFGHNYCVLFAV